MIHRLHQFHYLFSSDIRGLTFLRVITMPIVDLRHARLGVVEDFHDHQAGSPQTGHVAGRCPSQVVGRKRHSR